MPASNGDNGQPMGMHRLNWNIKAIWVIITAIIVSLYSQHARITWT